MYSCDLWEYLQTQIKLRRYYIDPHDFYDKVMEELKQSIDLKSRKKLIF